MGVPSNNDLKPRDDCAVAEFRIHMVITQDEEGIFSAVALNLPGAGSCGDTLEEAVENSKEAIRGVLESYVASGEEIPWKDTSTLPVPNGMKQQWISVNV